MSTANPGLAASIHQRLLNQSKAREVDFNLLLARFAVERFLYRLSCSPYGGQFVLKGAMLLQLWLPETARPTRDLDLLGFGDVSPANLRDIFASACVQPVEADGCEFEPGSVAVAAIRAEDEYGGQRVTASGRLGSARLHVQVDIGIGDSVTPPAEWIVYPTLLDFPAPRVRAYRSETTIAEKLQAMVALDLQNSRMKDFYDIWRLAETHAFSGRALAAAVRDTFNQRKTPIPAGLPTALTAAFYGQPSKAHQWAAFVARSSPAHAGAALSTAIAAIAAFVEPVLGAAHESGEFALEWQPGGPWRPGQGS